MSALDFERFTSRMVRANDIEIHVETIGSSDQPPVLLIMGNSAPGLVWPDAFCRELAGRGFYVVRFDQRDTGLSTYLDFGSSPYTLDTLVADVVGVLDAERFVRAHIVGLSQGGMLACRLAMDFADRVITMTAVMSSVDPGPKNDAFSGRSPRPGSLPAPKPEFVRAVIALNNGEPADENEAVSRFVENFRLAKGDASPFDEHAWHALGRAVAQLPMQRADGRSPKIANHSNHSRAQMASPPLCAADLGRIRCPVLLIHGRRDPIFPPEHARWAAAAIEHSRLVMIEDMGHALDPAFFEPVVTLFADFVQSHRL